MKTTNHSKNFKFMCVLVLGTLLLQSCSLLRGKQESTKNFSLEMGQKVYVSNEEDSAPVEKNAGETVLLEKRPLLIEAPGKVGLVIVPVDQADPQFMKIKLRDMDKWTDDVMDKKNDERLSSILSDIHVIHQHLYRKKTTAAVSAAENLVNKYPKISYLQFLLASCLVVDNQRGKAKDMLTELVKRYPDNREGKELLETLSKD